MSVRGVAMGGAAHGDGRVEYGNTRCFVREPPVFARGDVRMRSPPDGNADRGVSFTPL